MIDTEIEEGIREDIEQWTISSNGGVTQLHIPKSELSGGDIDCPTEPICVESNSALLNRSEWMSKDIGVYPVGFRELCPTCTRMWRNGALEANYERVAEFGDVFAGARKYTVLDLFRRYWVEGETLDQFGRSGILSKRGIPTRDGEDARVLSSEGVNVTEFWDEYLTDFQKELAQELRIEDGESPEDDSS